MCRLMQPTPNLPGDHPLMTLGGSEAARWTQREIQAFQQALLKYDKDFVRVSKEVGATGEEVSRKKVCGLVLVLGKSWEEGVWGRSCTTGAQPWAREQEGHEGQSPLQL